MAYQSEIEKLEQRFREKPEQWFAALADAYRKNGDLELALELVQTWIEKRPNYTSGHIVHGRVLLDKGQDPAASQAFERVLQLDAENIIALRSLSEIAERQGDVATARTWLTRLLEIDPMNEEAHATLERWKTAPPTPPAHAGAADSAVSGFEPTAVEHRSGEEPPGAPTVSEAAIELDTPEPTGPAEFAGDLVVERASQADGAVADEEQAPDEMDAGVEIPTGGAPADDLGLEAMEFEPPAAEDESAAATGGEPGPDLDVAAFDDSLGWGTGERVSQEISAEDLEQAERVHDEAVEDVPHELLEPASGDAEGVAEAAEAADVAGDEDEDGGGTDLPLIMPENMEPVPDGEPGEREPEPVTTETMADLYAKQGLIGEARDIYRRLVAERPGDPALRRRLDELEDAAAARPRETTPASRGVQYAAEATGGRSVREYLQALLAGQAERPSRAMAPPAPPDAPAVAPERAPAAEEPEPESAMAMESAFDEGDEPEGSTEGAGAPTQPAGDEVSLAAVFGDEPGAAPPPAAPPPEPPADDAAGDAGELAYDEFFDPGEKGGGGETDSSSGSSDSGEPDTDFQQWLKGLKT